MWEEVFDLRFSSYFAARPRRLARRFCSLALARLLAGGSWADAAVVLGQAPSYGRLANHQVVLLNRAGTMGGFAATLRSVAADPELWHEPIDYRLREELFGDFREIDIDSWRWITTRRLTPPVPLRAIPAATAWLWAHVTGLDWMDAPALRDLSDNAKRTSYQRFLTHYLPILREGLMAYERLLITRTS